jgi:hypothetical protein
MITSVPNESYSIHVSCALNLISTFSYDRIKDLHKWNKKTHSVGTGHKHQFIKWLKMLTIVSWSLVLYVVFCRSLFVLLCFLFWSLYCLLFFNTRIQITPSIKCPRGFNFMVLKWIKRKRKKHPCHQYFILFDG